MAGNTHVSHCVTESQGGSAANSSSSKGGILRSTLTGPQNPLSPPAAAVELLEDVAMPTAKMEMQEINRILCGHDVECVPRLRPSSSCQTPVPHSYTGLVQLLPAEILFGVMTFLDARSLFQCRAVCRSFNNALLSHGVQLPTSSLTRAVLDTTVGTDTLTGVVRRREARLRQSERAWALWMTHYLTARLGQKVDRKAFNKLCFEGKAQTAQLRCAQRSARRATEEWLGHQSDCCRVQHNIRRNWFNVASLSCTGAVGVSPVILPDGTLCINDPVDTILLYARRDRDMLPCFTRHAKQVLPSRAVEARRDLWAAFDKVTFSSAVSLLHYDPCTEALIVGLEKSEVVLLRVSSAVVIGLERRLEVGLEHGKPHSRPGRRVLRSPTGNIQESVTVLAHHRTTEDTRGSFVPIDVDTVGLPDYEWSLAEMTAVTQKHGIDVDLSRVIVVRREEDAAASLISTRPCPGVCLTSEDMLEITALRHALAAGDHNFGNNAQGETAQRGNFPAAPAAVGADAGAESGMPGSVVVTSAVESADAHTSGRTTLSINTTWEGSSIMRMGTNDTADTKHVMEKCVFAVFNEQAALTSVVARTAEAGVFALGPNACTPLGVNYSGDVKKAYVLQAPVFRRRETPPIESMDEGEATIAYLMASGILICQKSIIRDVKEAVKCVWSGSSLANSRKDRNRGEKSRKACTTHLRRCAWYFLRGYSYSSPSREMTVLREISSPLLLAFVSPRPWPQQHVMALANWRHEDSKTGQQKQHQEKKKPPNMRYWWSPFRDGHPYFRKPFMLYVAMYVPLLAFQRQEAGSSRQELPLEGQPRFQEVEIIEDMSQMGLGVFSVALSPTHAFFLLGMVNGAILLLSPSCTGIRDEAPQARSPAAEQLPSQPADEPTRAVSVGVTRRGVSSARGNALPQGAENGDEDEDEGEEEEEEDGEDVAFTMPRLPRAPLNHLYRTTLPETVEEIVRQRRRRQPHLRSFTATQMFGDGFREDPFIQEVQRGTKSVLAPMVGENSPANKMPLHAVWILAPRENSHLFGGAAVRSMHLDEWKLTTLSMSFEIAVYDLTPETRSGQTGMLVVPLLTLSPYKRHPFAGLPRPKEEFWFCAKLRQMILVGSKRGLIGSEMMWRNGLLLVSSQLGGKRCTIFDFSLAFRDPEKKGEGAPVAYSTTRREYHRCTSGVTLLIPAGENGAVYFPRHYPLLLRWEFLFLIMAVVRSFTTFCASLATALLMLRIDEYIAIPYWSILLLYSPFALNFLLSDTLLYDPYSAKGCGVPFYSHVVSDVLVLVVFPVLFTVRHDAYDKFHPSWVFITLSLDVGLALKPVPSAYLAIYKEDFCPRAVVEQLGKFVGNALYIAFIVLLSLYFDGPLATDPRKPKFDLFIAFLPVFVLLLFTFFKTIFLYYQTRNRAYIFFLAISALVILLPMCMFIWEFSWYYAVSNRGRMFRPSLTQTCFIIPCFFLLFSLYVAFSSVMLLASY
ncbi:uncharacterized protein Tco025E_04359 [Trypanosoma conorhini]|uniref:F-box domain-containing protein n=1 Tax=Trypanosoma conorhini TaxID=83891 RepID=A0A422PN73_9TRYP|nr:uncharacterized protein Tco025E_04359 [Trypanosoma conorhini]RNF19180.1 hypothetical protein Tco025E_04359 [Trypanosoma conorhini]